MPSTFLENYSENGERRFDLNQTRGNSAALNYKKNASQLTESFPPVLGFRLYFSWHAMFALAMSIGFRLFFGVDSA